MELANCHEIDNAAIYCMAVDAEERAIAFGMHGTIEVYVIDGNKLSDQPIFSLLDHAEALCYGQATVDDDTAITFSTVAINSNNLAFVRGDVDLAVYVWNWERKEALWTLYYSHSPCGLIFSGSKLHIQYNKFSRVVNVETGACEKTTLILTVDPSNKRMEQDARCKKLLSRRINLATRTMGNILCVLDYNGRNNTVYFRSYDPRTMQALQCDYAIATCQDPKYLSLQWIALNSRIYMWLCNDESYGCTPLVCVFKQKPWTVESAKTLMCCLQRRKMPIELSSCVLSSFLLAMK
jgi:WD40 repeat protein